MEGELANGEATEAASQNGFDHVHDSEADAPLLRLRLLCPHAVVPALIGKRGENIKRIRRESGAAVSVADHALGCEERVVHITGERVDDDAATAAADALLAVFGDVCSLQQQRRGDTHAAAPSPAPSSSDAADGGASDASGAGDGGGGAAPPAAPAARPVEARLLVDSSLVGFLVGRGGTTIKDTMARSGAGVRVLPKAELPACACVTDDLVRVSGHPAGVHAALRLLAGQVKAHTLRHGDARRGGGGGGGAPAPPLLVGQAPAELAYMQPSLAAATFYPPGAGHPGYAGAAVEASFRLLAPAARTGNIIGKGGEHVRRIRAETGARIKVFDPAPGSEERVVALTSSEDAMSPYCAAQDALIRCVLALVGDEPAAATQRVRLLTAQASVGCVLGKRGATVAQLRQETGASLKVLPAEPLPPAFGGGDDAPELELGSLSSGSGGGGGGGGGEEVVQVEGSVHQVVAALRGVATLLRGWQVRRLLTLQQHAFNGGGGMAGGPPPPLAAPIPASPTGGAVMSPTSPGIMGVHLPSSLSSPSQPPFMLVNGGMHSPPPAAHAMLPPGAVVVPAMGHHPMGPPPPRGMTYVYHLSNAQVGAVLGKGGAHIAQIRGMSGARVQLQGEGDSGGRVLMVAGHPEQVHAAHVMANAFLSMGRCEPAYPEPIHGG